MLENSLPPQIIEAEEAILGGILLDPEAMVRVADILAKNAFYVQAHQEIYHAAMVLHSQGKPTDLMTVSTWLADRSLLEKIGGTTKLAQLLNRTVSAANVDRYASLVMDKYVRRQLISAGHEIVDLGYDTAEELEKVLDESEQKIFRLTQERPQEGLVPISETIIKTFTEIENLHQEVALPGIPSGFYDLDAMTSGFSRSDLIIIAGRPSMGKCLAADTELICQDGNIKTIEEIYHGQQDSLLTLQSNWRFTWTQPSAFVDDGIKPVYQVTTRLGRKIKTTLTHPFLTIDGWRSLGTLTAGNKIAVPRKIEAWGNKVIAKGKVKLLAYLIGDGCLTGEHQSPQREVALGGFPDLSKLRKKAPSSLDARSLGEETSPGSHRFYGGVTVTKTCPEFTNGNPLVREDFIDALASFSGLVAKESNSNQTRTTSIRVSKDKAFIQQNRQIFAQNLSKAIANQEYSLSYIAKQLNISTSLISIWLKGECVPNQSIFDELCNLLKVTSQHLAPNGISAINNPNDLTIWLKELGLWHKNAHHKTIPPFIYTLKPDLLALFLNRLFATDGWATVLNSGQSQLGYATVSEKLARQIQHLLLRFDIIAKLKNRTVKYRNETRQVWQLDITDAKSIKNFIEEIGIFGKEESINAVREAISRRRYQTNSDLIPIAIWQELKQAKDKESWQSVAKRAGIKGYSNIHVDKRALSRERLFQLAYALESIPLQNLATSEVYWDTIVSIEYVGKQQVYDLTIPDTHNFVANDICVHNTAFCLNIASNIAREQKLPVAVFSLEMSREQLTQRMLSGEAKIASNRLRSGRISQNEFEPLINAVANLSDLPIYIDDTANLSVMQMRSQVRRLQAQQKDKLGLILLDYLQLMEGSGSDNRVQELSKITRSLKGLAREVNAPIIALSQLSRGVEQRTNKRPMLSDLRESGSIEQDADLVIMLYREDYYNPDTPDRGIAEIIITKHRNGPTGTVKLLFKAELTKFENLARPSNY